MAEEFKCVCGKVYKKKAHLVAHQRFCKKYLEASDPLAEKPPKEKKEPDKEQPPKPKKEQMIQIYVRNEITIGRKKYCGQVYVPIKLARNLQSIDDKADKSNIHDTQFKKHMGDSGDVEVSIGGASRQLRPLR